ncbi:Crp/Fnr family transcriptional regulator [Variovorax saccharolyticus]|uniref:Crp/Fnr family transcriptional regulator n=1 Tax=Variovorax saccharolyticus TaxID=3053516 RepID=UPI0025788159|nr:MULTISPECIES: cyclic nucleotide-binding domain-containing protein [unclassified Variovorax]MDM0018686.1 cyclic nucleotide-binding domain-containing protein [Variovorax sp. J22R187]MDM0029195.1 cyclic nucleotide-binding domain-containing protein [Variovorax sp. J31P216]
MALALWDTAIVTLTASIATPAGIVAVCSAAVAGALVVVSSFVKTMIPLRCLAVGGNLGFLVYGALHPSLIMMLLHGALLPINIWRTAEMVRLTRRVTAAAAENDLSGVWLRPYMRSRRMKAGRVLFRKGDAATHLYFLASGRIEFVEIGEMMEEGRLFGEIAFFAPDKRRTLTARCATDCTVLRIDETTFKQLYFQNPAFGFQVVNLVTSRLIADRQRLESVVEASRPASLGS